MKTAQLNKESDKSIVLDLFLAGYLIISISYLYIGNLDEALRYLDMFTIHIVIWMIKEAIVAKLWNRK